MILLSLDPSSTCCGYAIAEVNVRGVGVPALAYRDCGIIKPKAVKDTTKRIGMICAEVAAKIVGAREEFGSVDHAVVEVPGRPQAREQARAALATYMRAVGGVEATVGFAKVPTSIVDPNQWTQAYRCKGMDGKARRQQEAMLLAPGYDPALDKGGDCADAICLAQWWVVRFGSKIMGQAQP